MPKNDKSEKTSDEKIKKIEEEINILKAKLKYEISERQTVDEFFAKSLEQQKRYLLVSEKELEKDVDKLEDVKSEILGYTFQSVTIVVGMLALILTLTFLWLNIDNLSGDFFGLFVGILVFFGGMLVIWFFVWLRNN